MATKKKAAPRRRFSESKWRTDILARDLYIALIVHASKDRSAPATKMVTWDERCRVATMEALQAATLFEAVRKATR